MNKTFKIVLAIAFCILVVILVNDNKASDQATPITQTPQEEDIQGCYVARLAQDVYTLRISAQENSTVSGTLSYKNFEKDSSSGIVTGTYENTLLLGEYAFASEGINSIRQVVFKKVENGFIQGFGEVRSEGDREFFVDPNQVTFNPSVIFTLTDTCS